MKNTVKPCLPRAGWLRRSSFTTSGYENQVGISVPRASRSRSSVPVMSSVFLSLRHFVDRVVLVLVRHEDHLLEVDHLHAELFLVLLQQLLGIVRAVERLAARVLAGAGVVAADDQVRAAVVLADDRVPDRLARPAHPHRQRQQRQERRVLRVVGHQRLVAADAGVMVDVARLGHADDRVHEQVGLFFLGGAERQLVVGAVHRIAGLEGDDLPPAALGELLAELGRRVAERFVVVVQRQLQALDAAADVHRLALVHQVADGRVLGARRCRRRRSASASRSGVPDVLDVDHGEHHALGIAERDLIARLELVGELLGDVERDRHRPERAVREPHLVADRFVVGLAHEAGERREAAVAQAARGRTIGAA